MEWHAYSVFPASILGVACLGRRGLILHLPLPLAHTSLYTAPPSTSGTHITLHCTSLYLWHTHDSTLAHTAAARRKMIALLKSCAAPRDNMNDPGSPGVPAALRLPVCCRRPVLGTLPALPVLTTQPALPALALPLFSSSLFYEHLCCLQRGAASNIVGGSIAASNIVSSALSPCCFQLESLHPVCVIPSHVCLCTAPVLCIDGSEFHQFGFSRDSRVWQKVRVACGTRCRRLLPCAPCSPAESRTCAYTNGV